MFTPWVVFFVLGGPWFWGLTLGTIFWMCWLLDALDDHDYYYRKGSKYNGTWATVVFLGFVGLLAFCGDGRNFFEWIGVDPKTFLLWAVGIYIPAGISVSFVKWWYFNKDDDEEFREVLEKFLRDNGLAVVYPCPLEHRKKFLVYLQNGYPNRWSRFENIYDAKSKILPYWPVWRDNKARIGSWMTWWWIVGPWSLIDDVVRNLFKRIMQMFGGVFDRISNAIHGHMKENFDLPDEPETPPGDAPADTIPVLRPPRR